MQYLLIKIIIVILLMTAIFTCKSKPIKKSITIKDPNVYLKEGWLNESTFQIVGNGIPIKETRGFIRRRYQAKNNALNNAKKKALEYIISQDQQDFSQASEQKNNISTKDNQKLREQIQKIVDYGEILHEKYNDLDECQLTYGIYRKGLNTLIQKVFLKYKY